MLLAIKYVDDIPEDTNSWALLQSLYKDSHHDVINAFWHFAQDPKPGEVYNLGGGKTNAASLVECVALIEEICGKKPVLTYSEENRVGDHICYYSDLRKLKNDFPDWELTYDLPKITEEIIQTVMDQQRV